MTSSIVTTEYVKLTISDGTQMQAYVARPKGECKFPGIMVFQEAFGVNAHMRDVSERFASKGYVAIAPELYHRTAARGWEGNYTDFPSVSPHMQAIKEETLSADVRATYEWLTSASQVDKNATACVGYCMGGRVSFLSERTRPREGSDFLLWWRNRTRPTRAGATFARARNAWSDAPLLGRTGPAHTKGRNARSCRRA